MRGRGREKVTHMNDYAGLPWYLRHGLFAGFFGVFAIAERGFLVAAIVFVAVFSFTMAGQIAMDGWDRERW